ncbi:NAP1 [Symbiodinium necroappetens]|uniref:NAP1 protein n=1 Tax=Symbiodinium necroappetens TaxID=1628268 RepID=A0A812LX52_9DINO|nr:NAP1 [Symbiodinium necroappetens]
MPLLHLEDEEVGDLVTHLVETFRKGVNSFIEELDAKLRHEFEALERKEVQLRVERQALDEMRRCLRQEQDSLEVCKHRHGARKTQKQMKVRFNDEDEKQIVDPQIASEFLVNAPEPEPSPGDESESREAALFRRHSHLSLHPWSGNPKPSETVTIAGCQYAVLPSTSPEDETRPRLRGTLISVPSGWSLLSTSVDGFEYILQQLTLHCWGTPLIAIQSQKAIALTAAATSIALLAASQLKPEQGKLEKPLKPEKALLKQRLAFFADAQGSFGADWFSVAVGMQGLLAAQSDAAFYKKRLQEKCVGACQQAAARRLAFEAGALAAVSRTALRCRCLQAWRSLARARFCDVSAEEYSSLLAAHLEHNERCLRVLEAWAVGLEAGGSQCTSSIQKMHVSSCVHLM